MKLLIKIMFLFFLVLCWGCGDSGTSECDINDGNFEGDSIYLACGHPGWQDNNCSKCHIIPVEGHDSDLTIPGCAACHGGNGACEPPAVQWHPVSTCIDNCHGITHVYTLTSDCEKCHFASSGTVDCVMK